MTLVDQMIILSSECKKCEGTGKTWDGKDCTECYLYCKNQKEEKKSVIEITEIKNSLIIIKKSNSIIIDFPMRKLSTRNQYILCKYCNGSNVVSAGKRHNKTTEAKRKFFCKNCKKTFTINPHPYRIINNILIKNTIDILKLFGFSLRQIAKMISESFNIKISHGTICRYFNSKNFADQMLQGEGKK